MSHHQTITVADLILASELSQPELLEIAARCLAAAAVADSSPAPVPPADDRLAKLSQSGYGIGAGAIRRSPARPDRVLQQQKLEQELARSLEKAEAELTPEQYEVWQLYYYERMSFAEIARELGLREQRAVRDRLVRVKETMSGCGLQREMLDCEHEKPAITGAGRLWLRGTNETAEVGAPTDGMTENEGRAAGWSVDKRSSGGKWNHQSENSADRRQNSELLKLEAFAETDPAARAAALKRRLRSLRRQLHHAVLRLDAARIDRLLGELDVVEAALKEAATTESPALDMAAIFSSGDADPTPAGDVVTPPPWASLSPQGAARTPEERRARLGPAWEQVSAAQAHVMDVRKPWHGDGSSRNGQTLRRSAAAARRAEEAVAGRQSSLTPEQLTGLRALLNQQLEDRTEEQQVALQALREAGSSTVVTHSADSEEVADATALEHLALARLAARNIPGMVAAIRQALIRLETCIYGFCHSCSAEISYERLLVQPATLHCLNCVQKQEGKEHMGQVKAGEAGEGWVMRDLTPCDAPALSPEDIDEWRME